LFICLARVGNLNALLLNITHRYIKRNEMCYEMQSTGEGRSRLSLILGLHAYEI